MLANPLCSLGHLAGSMHFDRLGRREFITIFAGGGMAACGAGAATVDASHRVAHFQGAY
jgi:hypothetical protein